MFDLTFNPGPSQLSAATKQDITAAVEQHIPEISHRSQAFSEISHQAANHLRTFLSIPDDYTVLWLGSATEAMELSLRSVVEQRSVHFTLGNFSEKFAKISAQLGNDVHTVAAEWGQAPVYRDVQLDSLIDAITITHNETSTGVMCHLDDIKAVRDQHPDAFLIVDSTSIMGVAPVDIPLADMWLFSVQKCFGLPAGLGVLIANERSIARAEALIAAGKPAGAQSLPSLAKKMEGKHQTECTPNVMNIYLFMKQLERWLEGGGLPQLIDETKKKYAMLEAYITGHDQLEFYVDDPAVRSVSVVCVQPQDEALNKDIQQRCLEQGILLGNGYGKIKAETFRIANFPAHTQEDIERLMEIITRAQTD